MADEYLATYLNDHLAGSVAALDILEHLQGLGPEMARSLSELRADVETDSQELKALMHRLGIAESRTRKASGWVTEKIARLKLLLDDRGSGSFRLFEGLEAVSLGIEGKLSLWQALDAAAGLAPALQGMDYERLMKRAKEQRQRTEGLRLKAAKAALAEGSQARS